MNVTTMVKGDMPVPHQFRKTSKAPTSQRLHQSIVDCASYAIISTDRSGIITGMNVAAEQILGFQALELVGQRSLTSIFLDSEIDHRSIGLGDELGVEAQHGLCLLAEKPMHGTFSHSAQPMNELEWTLIRKDGSRVTVSIAMNDLRDPNGELIGYVAIARDVTRQNQAKQKLAEAAMTDQLTGLFNRARLMERLRGAIYRSKRQQKPFAVMFLDFDRFKSVNDSWGHDVGDQLLRQIADRLRAVFATITREVSQSVTIARLGGDEFVVLLENLEHADDSQRYVESLQASLNLPYALGPNHFSSTASIGIVVGPALYDRAEDILRDADTAMYEAKGAGRSRHVYFDEEMHIRVRRRLHLENELRSAIGTSQITLNFQPVLSLSTGEVTAVEGLLQWNNPIFGCVASSEFIPIAQESDLILRLGEWVLNEGCKQCARWNQSLRASAPLQVSLNLARKQFSDPGLLRTIQKALEANQLPPQQLLIEITEDAFDMKNIDAIGIMNSIRALGVELAIDGFGSGASSFVSLHQFPVNVLKVDRSMVKEIDTCKAEASLLHALVVMARNLDIQLVAEGIETESQLKAVQELGCQYAQGHFFAPAMTIAEFEDFIADTTRIYPEVVGAMAFANGWAKRMTYMVQAPIR